MTQASHRQRMLTGQPYLDSDPELVAARRDCLGAVDRFNALAGDDADGRAAILTELFGGFGPESTVMAPLRCDYGFNVSMGRESFINYDGILLDCARIVIGDYVNIGPRVQLLTALHPMDDHRARREHWETAEPIIIGDGVWMGGGVIVGPGVSIGADSVIGAGSVVTRDIPPRVFAAGNPARVIRPLG